MRVCYNDSKPLKTGTKIKFQIPVSSGVALKFNKEEFEANLAVGEKLLSFSIYAYGWSGFKGE